MPIGAIIGAGAAIGGSILSSKATKKAANKAADTSIQTAQMNNALARDIYGKNSANLTPFMQNGLTASNALSGLLAGNGSAWDQFRNSTNYDFRLGEGLKAANQGYAARGLLESGAALKGINNYAQNFASNELGNYMGLLAGQQNMGMAGASALAGVGQNLVNNVSANNNSAGSAAANAQLMVGQANANMWGGIAGGIGSLAGSIGSSFGGSGPFGMEY